MKSSPGLKIADRRRMAKHEPVIPVKEYGRSDFQAREPQQIDAGPPDLTLTVIALRTENKRLLDKISRLEEMIENELRYWKRGLDFGDWENREQLKRRMSRLRGAVEYLGNEHGWRVTEER